MSFTKKYNISDPSCAYKWSWSKLTVDSGTASSCHRVNPSKLTPDTFNNFHNTPETIEARKKMLAGEWPGNGCEYCKKIEQAGGTSDRFIGNEIDTEIYPSELIRNDVSVDNITPTILELHFSNVCNQGCVYCGPEHSSFIETERIRFGYLEDKISKSENSELFYNQFVNWFDKFGNKLKRLNILGGEPFYQPEVLSLLDNIEDKNLPNLQLMITSNINIEYIRFAGILNKLSRLIDSKKINSVEVVCSLDGLGKEEEYVRYGFTEEVFLRNLNELSKHHNISTRVHFTLCSLNIKCSHILAEKINYINNESNSNIKMSFSIVDRPKIYNPGIFEMGFFDDDFDKLIVLAPEHKKEQLIGFKKTINNESYSKNKISDLIKELEIIDEMRNTSWKDVFPWLSDVI